MMGSAVRIRPLLPFKEPPKVEVFLWKQGKDENRPGSQYYIAIFNERLKQKVTDAALRPYRHKESGQ